MRPTTNTGDALEDAFVWVKPGGEADGTSNSTAPRYDYHCGYSDALQPAPQAGTWFEVCLSSILGFSGVEMARICANAGFLIKAYFVQLLTNANPPL